MLSKFTVIILNSFFRPPPSNNNIVDGYFLRDTVNDRTKIKNTGFYHLTDDIPVSGAEYFAYSFGKQGKHWNYPVFLFNNWGDSVPLRMFQLQSADGQNYTASDYKQIITNSDLKRHHYNYENTGKDKEYAIQDVFYKLPADSDIHFVTVSCGNLFSLIVHKYIDHSYGSILRFGYADRLTQYRIGADKWYKADLNHTESQIEKLV